MTNYPKILLGGVIASKGDYTIPPLRLPKKGTGAMSIEKGFDVETAIPLEDGGVPPSRESFNGAFNLLSQLAYWYQQGGLMKYSTALNYEVDNEIIHEGKKWRCCKENGKDSKLVTPGTDTDYWKVATASRIPGEVVPFHNVRLGGTDGRRPIFWGESEADEGWVLCDGGSDGRGGNVPDLMGRCVEGSKPNEAGGKSGGISVASSGLPVGAIVMMAGKLDDPSGEYVPVSQSHELSKSDYPEAAESLGTAWGSASSGKFKLPALANRYLRISGSTSSTKDKLGYYEEAGLPNIKGEIGVDDRMTYYLTGAFYKTGSRHDTGTQYTEYGFDVGFDASRYNKIYGRSDTVTPKNAVIDAYVHVKPSAPKSTANGSTTAKRYKLAYFVKLPN